METQSNVKLFGNIRQTAAKVAVAALCLLGAVTASAALTVNVVGVGPDGKALPTTASPTEYRWTVEEDATKLSIPISIVILARRSRSPPPDRPRRPNYDRPVIVTRTTFSPSSPVDRRGIS